MQGRLLLPVLLLLVASPLVASAQCSSSPCTHGGTCVASTASFACACPQGFSGDLCEVDQNECLSDPCLNLGTCIDQPGSFSCICLQGITGERCNLNVDECESSPCQHSTSCDDLFADYHCHCEPGWSGKNCDDNIDECQSTPCANGGSCVDLVNGFICLCPAGTAGATCNTDAVNECASSPCVNGASCSQGIGFFLCSCQPGFVGVHCETNVDECASAPCLNGATCNDLVNRFSCACSPGFTDSLCATDMDECESNPCMHGATCVNAIDHFVCVCPGDFMGTRCEMVPPTSDSIIESLLNATVSPASVDSLATALESATATHLNMSNSGASNAFRMIDRIVGVRGFAVSSTARSAVLTSVSDMFLSSRLRENGVTRAAATTAADTSSSSAPNSAHNVAPPAAVLESLSARLVDQTLSPCGSTTSEFAISNSTGDIVLTAALVHALTLPFTTFAHHSSNTSAIFSSALALYLNATYGECSPVFFNVMARSVATSIFVSQQQQHQTGADRRRGTNMNDNDSDEDDISQPRAGSIVSGVVSVGVHYGQVHMLPDGVQDSLIEWSLAIDPNLSDETLARLRCAAWNFTTSEWYTNGCTMVSLTSSLATCRCSHLTNFAVLVDVQGGLTESVGLTVASYIGLAICIIAVLAVLLVYSVLHKLRTVPIKLLMILCVTILGTALCFIVSTSLGAGVSQAACFVVGMLLHYTVLAQFVALAVNGLGLYKLLVAASDIHRCTLRRYVLSVALVPLAIVVVYMIVMSAVSDDFLADAYGDAYNDGRVCFVPSSIALSIVVVAPAAIALLLNIVIFALVVNRLKAINAAVPQKNRENRAGVYFSIAFLLGVSWLFGLLVVVSPIMVFAWIFALGLIAQGAFLLAHYVFASRVRVALKEYLQQRRARSSSSSGASASSSSGKGRSRATKTTAACAASATRTANCKHGNSSSEASSSGVFTVEMGSTPTLERKSSRFDQLRRLMTFGGRGTHPNASVSLSTAFVSPATDRASSDDSRSAESRRRGLFSSMTSPHQHHHQSHRRLPNLPIKSSLSTSSMGRSAWVENGEEFVMDQSVSLEMTSQYSPRLRMYRQTFGDHQRTTGRGGRERGDHDDVEEDDQASDQFNSMVDAAAMNGSSVMFDDGDIPPVPKSLAVDMRADNSTLDSSLPGTPTPNRKALTSSSSSTRMQSPPRLSSTAMAALRAARAQHAAEPYESHQSTLTSPPRTPRSFGPPKILVNRQQSDRPDSAQSYESACTQPGIRSPQISRPSSSTSMRQPVHTTVSSTPSSSGGRARAVSVGRMLSAGAQSTASSAGSSGVDSSASSYSVNSQTALVGESHLTHTTTSEHNPTGRWGRRRSSSHSGGLAFYHQATALSDSARPKPYTSDWDQSWDVYFSSSHV